ncbi:hypothetical protein ACGFYQ_41290 [Streptomyces sp. NPDC048258]|uniref:hypothetical protein n=1 Tax=Streptomyces sp. NPDC048258 TaxID=3365527 RepID=UPI003711242C
MDPQITTALIGAVGVIGTVGGTVLGSWLQARGGRAQAAAAREAATTAARAAHDQAVRERVWTVVPLHLRAASQYVDAINLMWQTDAQEELRAAQRAFALTHAEAELAVPEETRSALGDLQRSMVGLRDAERTWAKNERAFHVLRELSESGDTAASRALGHLGRLDRAEKPHWMPHLRAQTPPEYGPAVESLDAVAALIPPQRSALLRRTQQDPQARRREREQAMAGYRRARQAVINQTRVALGSSAAAPSRAR